MKRVFGVCFLVLLPVSFIAAQDAPHYELFVGGSYLRIHAGGLELTQLVNIPSIQYQPHNLNFNDYGWEGTLIENVNQWLGGEVDVAGFYGSPNAHFLYPASQLLSPSPNFSQPVPVNARTYTAMFGPRFNLRTHGWLVLFAHLPVGVANTHTSLKESAVVASDFLNLPVGTLKSSTGLAISPGVGLDMRINSKFMIRVFQLDYLMTHVLGERQDNFRVTVGVNFTFGEK